MTYTVHVRPTLYTTPHYLFNAIDYRNVFFPSFFLLCYKNLTLCTFFFVPLNFTFYFIRNPRCVLA